MVKIKIEQKQKEKEKLEVELFKLEQELDIPYKDRFYNRCKEKQCQQK